MSTFPDREGARRRRRRALRWVGLPIGALLAWYAVAFALTYTDRYARVSASAWETRDPRYIHDAAQLADAMRGGAVAYQAELHARSTDPGQAQVGPAVRTAAADWVLAVNAANPNAILYHDLDAHGNLYVVFGAWWTTIGPDQQVKALDAVGMAWRRFLQDTFGPWDTQEPFAPGMVVVDTQGKVAENLDGKVKIFRQPVY